LYKLRGLLPEDQEVQKRKTHLSVHIVSNPALFIG
jgi:hypothetical protein